MRKFEIIVILLLIVIIGGGLYWLNKDNSISMQQEGKTILSPTQIKSIEAIGQWEFLSISDEELIDTVRKGLISDDELVRIYYGTLRLGINMREVGTEWLSAEGDTIICTLPPSGSSTATSSMRQRHVRSSKKANGPVKTDRTCTKEPMKL